MIKDIILKRVDEIMEFTDYVTNLDIQIHVDKESCPTISYQVDELVVLKDEQ